MKYTTLVNKTHKWKESYLKNLELVEATDKDGNKIQLEKETYQAYQKLQAFLKKENMDIVLSSAYRSISTQQALYDEMIREKGVDYVKQFVAEPGYSEHHTGLALDIEILSIEEDLLNEKYQRMHQVLPQFGFILRYPKNKKEITGYDYEPWHIRYVGTVPARIMYERGLTLEEYLQSYGCLLCINKPQGLTSFDVVNEISHIYGIKRVGHTGTLDPLATGVLIVAIGQATKIVELLTAQNKEYVATANLGYETDTYDITGTITKKKENSNHLELEKTISSFQKTYLQEVPIYSAIKVAGKKLYEYARQKKEVTLPKKEVTIKEIELLERTDTSFKIRTLVSKGCYIRSLIRDIGIELGTYATMSSLERTKQGSISIEETNTLEEVKQGQAREYSIEEVLDYPIIEIEETLYKKIKNGVPIPNQYQIKDKVLFTYQSELLGIYQVEKEYLKTWKNFM